MATFSKILLSASDSGRAINIGTTGSNATLIHQAVAGTVSFDEIWLYAINAYGSNVGLTIYWGGTSVSDKFQMNVPANGAGHLMVTDGRLLNNSNLVQASCEAAGTNGIFVEGFVNRIQ